MPTLSAATAIVLALLVGMITGWILRAKRGKAEKISINEGWHAQMEATRREHGRLTEQNRSLREQIGQLRDSSLDTGNRARELSAALKEALARHDELQREIRVVRAHLETVVGEKRRLSDDLSRVRASETERGAALAERDRRIAKLETQLRNWQDRLPPLVERFRKRDEEADRLAAELTAAEEQLRGLEDMLGSDQTRVEPLAVDGELEEFVASNEQLHPASDEVAVDPDPAVGAEYADEDEDADDIEAVTDALSDTENGSRLRDNLREIKGIGPAIEKTLNELGIFRFGQVAQMTRYDIERIANRLKGFQSRIEREDWIGQARELTETRAEAANEAPRSIDGQAS